MRISLALELYLIVGTAHPVLTAICKVFAFDTKIFPDIGPKGAVYLPLTCHQRDVMIDCWID